MISMTLDCVIPTQSSVIQTIHCNVCLKCFFQFLPKCLLLSLYAYFINISQSNVETHLRRGGNYTVSQKTSPTFLTVT